MIVELLDIGAINNTGKPYLNKRPWVAGIDGELIGFQMLRERNFLDYVRLEILDFYFIVISPAEVVTSVNKLVVCRRGGEMHVVKSIK